MEKQYKTINLLQTGKLDKFISFTKVGIFTVTGNGNKIFRDELTDPSFFENLYNCNLREIDRYDIILDVPTTLVEEKRSSVEQILRRSLNVTSSERLSFLVYELFNLINYIKNV